MYAMSGMSTELHLMADTEGSYNGSSANISGRGFAGMKFTAKAVSGREFKEWSFTARQSSPLDKTGYDKLAQPSENNPVATYALAEQDLYNQVVAKYMPYQHENGASQ